MHIGQLQFVESLQSIDAYNKHESMFFNQSNSTNYI